MKVYLAKNGRDFTSFSCSGDETEVFNKLVLFPLVEYAITTRKVVTINIDNCVFPACFLKKTFGELLNQGYTIDSLAQYIYVESTTNVTNRYLRSIDKYMKGM